MDRDAELRRSLTAALAERNGDLTPLDLVEDIPLLETFVDDAAAARVADARLAGASWAAIAGRLGVTRQAAHKRFGRRVGGSGDEATLVR